MQLEPVEPVCRVFGASGSTSYVFFPLAVAPLYAFVVGKNGTNERNTKVGQGSNQGSGCLDTAQKTTNPFR